MTWRSRVHRLTQHGAGIAGYLPAPIRQAVGRAIRRSSSVIASEVVADWSTPLFDAPDATPGPTMDSPGPAQLAQPAPAAELRSPSLHCLLITESIDVGGMDEVVAFLARNLPAHGIRTTVVHASLDSRRPVGRLGEALRAEGIEVLDKRRFDDALWLRQLAPDVASVHGAAEWSVELAGRSGIPVVETLHGMHSLFGAKVSAVSSRAAHLSGLVAVSELVRRQYLAINAGFDPQRVVTVPNGVDHHRREPPPRAKARRALGIADQFVFVSLARHCLQKNTYGLVSAFAEVAEKVPDAHLVIAGRPDDLMYAAAVRDLKLNLPHGDRVHLRDHARNPAALLSAADAFVLDSFFEGWSLASMEALCVGLPVVLADVGGAREQVATGLDKGFVVSNPVGDPLAVDWAAIRSARYSRQPNRSELTDAMVRVAGERSSWRESRPAIAHESVARFSPELSARRHAAVLTAAAAGRPLTLHGDLAVPV